MAHAPVHPGPSRARTAAAVAWLVAPWPVKVAAGAAAALVAVAAGLAAVTLAPTILAMAVTTPLCWAPLSVTGGWLLSRRTFTAGGYVRALAAAARANTTLMRAAVPAAVVLGVPVTVMLAGGDLLAAAWTFAGASCGILATVAVAVERSTRPRAVAVR